MQMSGRSSKAYMDYGIYTDIDGQYYEEECFVYDLHPYYVKTVDGNYVYLFCEDVEEDRREMRLVFFQPERGRRRYKDRQDKCQPILAY